jgi:hypothetical protein
MLRSGDFFAETALSSTPLLPTLVSFAPFSDTQLGLARELGQGARVPTDESCLRLVDLITLNHFPVQ